MKYKIFGSMSVLAVCFALAPVARVVASEASVAIVTPNIAGKAVEANAFNLASLAKNGYLQAQGIPSGLQLSRQIATGQITGADIVKAAVQAKQASPDALNDQAYIRAIEYNLAEPRISD